VLTLTGLALGRIYLQFIVWERYPHTALADMIAGTAYRPFVTRALAPLVIHAIGAVMGWPMGTAATALVYISMIGCRFRPIVNGLGGPIGEAAASRMTPQVIRGIELRRRFGQETDLDVKELFVS
jgi:hypothetical protein